MNKFDHSIKLPDTFRLVKVFYRQGAGEGWGLCGEVGFWDGNFWYRFNHDGGNRFTPQALRYVEGWEEINFTNKTV